MRTNRKFETNDVGEVIVSEENAFACLSKLSSAPCLQFRFVGGMRVTIIDMFRVTPSECRGGEAFELYLSLNDFGETFVYGRPIDIEKIQSDFIITYSEASKLAPFLNTILTGRSFFITNK